ncbi:MAG: PD40 domain-containing protein [Bacteroidales bacterium]|nr:PD40 domain-containing protein [Bacteroidales bacterium]
MKKVLIAAALLVASISAYAQFGVMMPSEKKNVKDPNTGVTLTVLTNTEGNDKFIYQTDPMWTPDGKWLHFRSSSDRVKSEPVKGIDRQGKEYTYVPGQYFFMEIATGKTVQVTDGSVGSVFLANKSNKLFVNKRVGQDWNMYEMNLDTFFADAKAGKAKAFDSYLKYIGTFPQTEEMGRPGGWCVNSDDTYAFISVSRQNGTPEDYAEMQKHEFNPRPDQPKKITQSLSGLRKMDLKTGEVTMIANVNFKVGHIQASRYRPNEIVFCCETGGDAHQRMWYADANTNTFKPLYVETPLDWVTHETFGTEDYVYFNVLGWQPQLRKQAHGIFRINLRTDDIDCLGNVEMDKDRSSSLTGRGFWHCNSTRDNKWAAGDTFAGSIWLIDVETGHKYHIASDIKMAPDHGHPFFSPDGTKLCFQSGHYSDGKRLNLVMVDLTKLPYFKK